MTELVDYYFMDGTFLVTPPEFYQTFNIAAEVEGIVVLVFTVLMTSKNSLLYKEVLRKIAQDFPRVTPKHVMADFEGGISVAVKEVFPNAAEHGCQYHYSNAVQMRAKEPGKEQQFCLPFR